MRSFTRFARREAIDDTTLAAAIRQAETGLIDADLGGGLIKLRIARSGGGKRGGYRTIIAYRAQARAVFLFGFAKNEQGNITSEQLVNLRDLARDLLGATDKSLSNDVEDGLFEEVKYDE